MEFKGKVAIVTGGNSGIGRATAMAFAREGASVMVSARREQEGQEVIDQISKEGGKAQFIKTDVAERDQIKAMVESTLETYGRLDFAFNNAGVEGTPFVSTAHYDEATWDQVISINLTSVFLCMKYQIPHILESGDGAIVNMSSMAGLVGGPNGIAYFASKHGVVGMTKAAAYEYATQGIRINAVCPAVVRTPMVDKYLKANSEIESQVIAAHPMGRLGTVDEVAEAVMWLCSKRSSYTTGQALPIDGGRLII